MNRPKLKFLVFFLLILVINCEKKKEDSSNFERAKAFEKINNKNKSLKSKEKRIENYKSAVDKSKKFNKSLEKNYTYSGYGSNKTSNPSSLLKNELDDSKANLSNKKVIFKSSKKSTAIFSAYSTN